MGSAARAGRPFDTRMALVDTRRGSSMPAQAALSFSSKAQAAKSVVAGAAPRRDWFWGVCVCGCGCCVGELVSMFVMGWGWMGYKGVWAPPLLDQAARMHAPCLSACLSACLPPCLPVLLLTSAAKATASVEAIATVENRRMVVGLGWSAGVLPVGVGVVWQG